MSALSLLSLAFVFSLCNADSEDCNDDWEVHYFFDTPSNANFRIYNPCNSRQYFQVRMTSLIEYDSDDSPTSNAITSFESVSGDWDHHDVGDDNEYEGNDVLSNVFRADDIIAENVDFELETIFFKENALIWNNTVALPQFSLKWNMDLEDWPFLNADNTLKLCINATTYNAERGRKDSSISDNNGDRNTLTEWNIGNFGLRTLSYADCDDSEQIAVVVKDETHDASNERNICFIFDYCESGTIHYDPIISYIATSDTGLTLVHKVAIGASAGVVFLIVCGVILCCIYKKKKHGSHKALLDPNTENVKGVYEQKEIDVCILDTNTEKGVYQQKEGVPSAPYEQ